MIEATLLVIGAVLFGAVVVLLALYWNSKPNEDNIMADLNDQFWYIDETDNESSTVWVQITEGEFAGFRLSFYNIQVDEEEDEKGNVNLSYHFDVLETNSNPEYDLEHVVNWDLDANATEGTPEHRLVLCTQKIVEGLIIHAMKAHDEMTETVEE